jgi:transcriptional regulator with XRE-family HTH domain
MAEENVRQAFKTVKERSSMKKARIAAHLSQKQAAKGCGVIERTYLNWEKAYTTPHLCEIKDLRDTIKFIGTDEELLEVFFVEVSVEKQDAVEEPQYALEPMEEPEDSLEPEKEPLTLDAQRRKTIGIAFKAAGLGFYPGTAILTGPIIGPELYLPMAGIAVNGCWEHVNHGELNKVERSLHVHLSPLAEYANRESEYQTDAAELMVQVKVIEMIMATLRNDAPERRKLATDAVRYGRLSRNPFALAVAQDWQGSTIIYFYRQPERAINIFHDALAGIEKSLGSSDAMLNRSSIYSGLAIAHAQIQDETHAKENRKLAESYIELAYRTMPSNPELEPFYQGVRMGTSELDQYAGRTHLFLSERFPHDRYGRMAFDAFSNSVNKPSLSLGYRGQALIRRADGAIAIGERDEYESSMREGLSIAIKINSPRRFSEMHDVSSRIPEKWQNETLISNLHDDIAEAQRALITPPTA